MAGWRVPLGAWAALGQVGNSQEAPSRRKAKAKASRLPGLIQRYRELLQVRHYARRTLSSYEQWLRRFLEPSGDRGGDECFTQNQALAALLFLYRRVLGSDVGNLEG